MMVSRPKHHVTSRNRQSDMMTAALPGLRSQAPLPGNDQHRAIAITVTPTTLSRVVSARCGIAPSL